MKIQPIKWKKIFENPKFDVWYWEYIKNSYNSTTKWQTTQLKNGQRTWIDISLKKTYKWPTSVWKDVQHQVNALQNQWNKKQNKNPTTRYHLTPVRMAIIKNKQTNKQTKGNNCRRGYREIETLVHSRWKCKMVQLL